VLGWSREVRPGFGLVAGRGILHEGFLPLNVDGKEGCGRESARGTCRLDGVSYVCTNEE